MEKFNRAYAIYIDTNDGGQIEILPPFTIEFNINRNVLSSANTASIKIYNLSETTRSRIAKDRMDFDLRKNILFMAGYGDDLSVALSGSVSLCRSVRVGTNFITTIECFDAGYAYANAVLEQAQYTKGYSRLNVVNDLINRLRPFGVEKGKIGKIEGSLSRGNSFTGPIIKAIQDMTNGAFFIDNGKAYVLGENEVIEEPLRVITSESGLLGTPVKENTFLEFDILFEPRVVVGQIIEIESVTGAVYNGQYKIVSLSHDGMISDSISGSATTRLGCFIGPNKLERIQ